MPSNFAYLIDNLHKGRFKKKIKKWKSAVRDERGYIFPAKKHVYSDLMIFVLHKSSLTYIIHEY